MNLLTKARQDTTAFVAAAVAEAAGLAAESSTADPKNQLSTVAQPPHSPAVDQTAPLPFRRVLLPVWLDPAPRPVPGVDAAGVLLWCDRCGSDAYRDVVVHEGASLRRDCDHCGRTLGWPAWGASSPQRGGGGRSGHGPGRPVAATMEVLEPVGGGPVGGGESAGVVDRGNGYVEIPYRVVSRRDGATTPPAADAPARPLPTMPALLCHTCGSPFWWQALGDPQGEHLYCCACRPIPSQRMAVAAWQLVAVGDGAAVGEPSEQHPTGATWELYVPNRWRPYEKLEQLAEAARAADMATITDANGGF
jgi:hypothetical protein